MWVLRGEKLGQSGRLPLETFCWKGYGGSKALSPKFPFIGDFGRCLVIRARILAHSPKALKAIANNS
jgi:hypothetical protein